MGSHKCFIRKENNRDKAFIYCTQKIITIKGVTHASQKNLESGEDIIEGVGIFASCGRVLSLPLECLYCLFSIFKSHTK